MDNTNIKKIIENDPFLKFIGIKVLELKKGYCKISAAFKHDLTRSGGILNGGAIATIADAAGGCAVLMENPGKNYVTVDLSLSFIRPIKNGPITAEGKLTKSGKMLSFADIKIFDGDNVECAVAKGTWFFMPF